METSIGPGTAAVAAAVAAAAAAAVTAQVINACCGRRPAMPAELTETVTNLSGVAPLGLVGALALLPPPLLLPGTTSAAAASAAVLLALLLLLPPAPALPPCVCEMCEWLRPHLRAGILNDGGMSAADGCTRLLSPPPPSAGGVLLASALTVVVSVLRYLHSRAGSHCTWHLPCACSCCP